MQAFLCVCVLVWGCSSRVFFFSNAAVRLPGVRGGWEVVRCDLAQQRFPNCVSQANIKNVGSLSSLHPVLRVMGHTVYRTRNNRSCVLVCARACVYLCLQ